MLFVSFILLFFNLFLHGVEPEEDEWEEKGKGKGKKRAAKKEPARSAPKGGKEKETKGPDEVLIFLLLSFFLFFFFFSFFFSFFVLFANFFLFFFVFSRYKNW